MARPAWMFGQRRRWQAGANAGGQATYRECYAHGLATHAAVDPVARSLVEADASSDGESHAGVEGLVRAMATIDPVVVSNAGQDSP